MNIYWDEHKLAEDVKNGGTGMYSLKSNYKSGYDLTGGNGRENSIILHFEKKPNWFHRTCSRFFLGWKWNDGDEK